MFSFRRKKEDPESSESLAEIKPVRRRKKKEDPPKPWGRLERTVVLLVLLAAPILSVIFFIKSQSPSEVLAPKIVEDLLPLPKDTSELKNTLASQIQNFQGTYGIWIQALDNSYALGINENDNFDGASLFKLPLMIAYYQAVDKGTIRPDTTYSLKHSDQASGAGTLATLPVGTTVTYKDMVEAMGKSSDNTAFQIMENVLGTITLTDVIREVGMVNTDFATSKTTPYDTGLLFFKLVNTDLISKKSKDEFLSFLVKTDYEHLIPQGLPDDIRIAHKYGTNDNTLNDAGIIYANKPFILVIQAKNTTLEKAQVEFPEITRLVYEWAVR